MYCVWNIRDQPIPVGLHHQYVVSACLHKVINFTQQFAFKIDYREPSQLVPVKLAF